MAICIVFITISLSTLLFAIAEHVKFSYGGRNVNAVIASIALVIPVIIAASRQIIDLGDTTLYGRVLYDSAKTMSFMDYYKTFHKGYYAIEILYLIISYGISNITYSYHGLLFFISIFNNFLIYDGLKKLKAHFNIEVWFAMFIFYFLYYGQTLNIVRQSLAVAIVFWGIHLIFEKKPLKFFLCVLMASLIHVSAVLGVTLYILYSLLYNKKYRKQKVFIIALIMFFLVFQYQNMFVILRYLNILPSKFYSLYSISSISVSPYAILTKGPIVIFFGWRFAKTYKDMEILDLDKWYLFLLLVIDFLVSQLAGANADLVRLSLYFAYAKIILFSSVSSKKVKLWLQVYCLLCFFLEYGYYGEIPVNLFGGM